MKDIATLHAFVIAAQKAYGSGNIQLQKSDDGRKTLIIENDDLKLTDEFDGGNPYCGIIRLVDKAEQHVVWASYYHGYLTTKPSSSKIDVETIFNFLREALQNPAPDSMVRGAKTYKAGNLTYVNDLESGNFGCFYGHEAIYDQNNLELYYGRYGGGFVDLSEDTGEA